MRPVVYFTSQYPAPSHTFIEREIAGLRAHGIDVRTATVRPCPRQASLSAAAQAERETTFSVLPVSPLRLLGCHAWALLRDPAAYLRTARRALGHRAPGTRGTILAAAYFAETPVLARHLAGIDARHLHNHFANPAANVGMLAAAYLGLPWSLTLHGSADLNYPAGLLLPEKLVAARHVMCASHFMRAQAMRAVAPVHWDKFVVVRCGVPMDVLDAIAAEPVEPDIAPTPKPLRLVCVARLSPEKGHATLLRALARLQDVDFHLEVVGDGPEREGLHEEARRLGLSERITWRGQLASDDTLRAIRRSDVLVLASFMEGLPVVLMEALALEVAVVAPRITGIPELVVEGQTGLMFTVGRDDELADALRRMGDAALREAMARRGRARVLEEFTTDAAVVPLVPLLAAAEPDARAD